MKRHAESRRPVWRCRIRHPMVGTETWASPVWGQRGSWADGEDAPGVGNECPLVRTAGRARSPSRQSILTEEAPAPHGRAGANSAP